jgi:hypothetical protein
MSKTDPGGHVTREVPEGWSEALGQATDRLRMVPKEVYDCPDELVRVFVVANEIHRAGSLEPHHRMRLARAIGDLEDAVARVRGKP